MNEYKNKSNKVKTKRRPQIHLYLTTQLMEILLRRSGEYGLTPAQYTKYMLVKNLDAYMINLNIKGLNNKTSVWRDYFDK